METVSALLAICAGNSPVPGEFPAQRRVTWSFDVFFDLRPNKRLSKHWRDLRRHRAHYDVRVMIHQLQTRKSWNGYDSSHEVLIMTQRRSLWWKVIVTVVWIMVFQCLARVNTKNNDNSNHVRIRKHEVKHDAWFSTYKKLNLGAVN